MSRVAPSGRYLCDISQYKSFKAKQTASLVDEDIVSTSGENQRNSVANYYKILQIRLMQMVMVYYYYNGGDIYSPSCWKRYVESLLIAGKS